MKLSRVTEPVMEVLFPSKAKCLGCGDLSGQTHPFLCDECMSKLPLSMHMMHAKRWPEDGLSLAWFPLYYEGTAARLVKALKYDSVWRLADFLAECMVSVMSGNTLSYYDCLVPVPLHPSRLFLRGYNQAGLLAEGIHKRTGIPVNESIARTTATRQQAKRTLAQRYDNVRGAFAATARFDGKKILLVDDVLTTGSTGNNCAMALRQAGAQDVDIITCTASRYYRITPKKVYKPKIRTLSKGKG